MLAANPFYAAMSRKSPEGFEFNTIVITKLDSKGKDPDGGDARIVFDDETRTLLQKAASDAAVKFNQ